MENKKSGIISYDIDNTERPIDESLEKRLEKVSKEDIEKYISNNLERAIQIPDSILNETEYTITAPFSFLDKLLLNKFNLNSRVIEYLKVGESKGIPIEKVYLYKTRTIYHPKKGIQELVYIEANPEIISFKERFQNFLEDSKKNIKDHFKENIKTYATCFGLNAIAFSTLMAVLPKDFNEQKEFLNISKKMPYIQALENQIDHAVVKKDTSRIKGLYSFIIDEIPEETDLGKKFKQRYKDYLNDFNK